MNYGELLSEAFRLTWRNRFLWFFGFFVGGASFNLPTNFAGQPGAGVPSGPMRALSENLAVFVAVVVTLAVGLALVFAVLAMISHGALAEGIAALHRGEARRFGPSWRAGTSNFWRVVGLKLLFFLMALGLALLLLLPAGLGVAAVLAITDSAAARALFIVLIILFAFLAFVAVFLPFAIVNQFALRELVVGRKRVLDSIGGGFGTFKRNIGRSLLAWIVQLGVMIALGIATVVVLVLLAAVFLGPAAALFAADQRTAAVVAAVVGALPFVAALLVISGALGAFNHTYWTLAYLRLTSGHGGEPAQASAA